jgi:hypothetical protein
LQPGKIWRNEANFDFRTPGRGRELISAHSVAPGRSPASAIDRKCWTNWP